MNGKDSGITWKHILFGVLGFVLGFAICMPHDILLLPRYEILLTDAAGHGFPAARVQQQRTDFAITGFTSSSYATADSYGRAAFPSVTAHTSRLHEAILCLQVKHAHGLQTPCGYSQQIAAEIPGHTEVSRTETDLPLKDRGHLLHITLQPAQP